MTIEEPHDEDITSVLRGDNRLVERLGVTHPQLARPLFHVWNLMLTQNYIMRYGLYEGHTEYRADPIAIAFIFGMRSLAEIEVAYPGKLREALTMHFSRRRVAGR